MRSDETEGRTARAVALLAKITGRQASGDATLGAEGVDSLGMVEWVYFMEDEFGVAASQEALESLTLEMTIAVAVHSLFSSTNVEDAAAD